MTTTPVARAATIMRIRWNMGPVEVDAVTLWRKEGDPFESCKSVRSFPPVLLLLADGMITDKYLECIMNFQSEMA
jgi:hypothetical protein